MNPFPRCPVCMRTSGLVPLARWTRQPTSVGQIRWFGFPAEQPDGDAARIAVELDPPPVDAAAWLVAHPDHSATCESGHTIAWGALPV